MIYKLKYTNMAVLKVIEVLASSKVSWEDASKEAVKHACKTIKNLRSVYVKEQSMTVDDGNIVDYRVTLKLSFELE